jgi:uncharacterized phiE125 gp8 family phage protein
MDIRYKLKTAPTLYPVSLTELKANLHILNTDQDTLLQDLIYAAVADAEAIMGRQIMRATWNAYLDGYPEDDNLEITLGPVDAITSVKYLADGASVWTTVSSSYYQLDNSELTARIRFLNSFSPDPDKLSTVDIEFTNGWAAAANVPKTIKQAVILLASEAYLHPENQMLNFGASLRTTAAERMLRNYKVKRY